MSSVLCQQHEGFDGNLEAGGAEFRDVQINNDILIHVWNVNNLNRQHCFCFLSRHSQTELEL